MISNPTLNSSRVSTLTPNISIRPSYLNFEVAHNLPLINAYPDALPTPHHATTR